MTENQIPLSGSSPITEPMIRRLVETFYARVRQDNLIGPIFNARVADWDEHLAKLTAFWASVILRKPGYDGRPMRPHLMMPVDGRHFDRWLDLFEANALAQLPREIAALFVGAPGISPIVSNWVSRMSAARSACRGITAVRRFSSISRRRSRRSQASRRAW